VSAVVDGVQVKAGSATFAGSQDQAPDATEEAHQLQSRVYVALNGQPLGYYVFRNVYRPALQPILADLSQHYRLAVLSGDNSAEHDRLRELFGPKAELRFHQSPQDKLDYVAALRQQGRRVLMVGDGLNDAGALQQADAGIALTDTLTNFSPACDAILDASSFGRFATFLRFSHDCLHIILVTFVLSFCYNGVGLGLAVQGKFTPIVSAILMPISSLSVMIFSTLLVRYAALKRGL